jgi:hypothetical protein
VTLFGLSVAVFRVGPLGLFGFLFEWIGASTFFAEAEVSALFAV